MSTAGGEGMSSQSVDNPLLDLLLMLSTYENTYRHQPRDSHQIERAHKDSHGKRGHPRSNSS